jgi:hypothetical protein
MGSFFRNQTFPQNWHRRPSTAGFDIVGEYAGVIEEVNLSILPGANNDQGVYVVDNITDVSVVSCFPKSSAD